jgi:glycosyltransferase involved in cell wall biosynthesis
LTAARQPYLSIVMPVFNEERRIGESLRRVGEAVAAQPYACEVIVVDDGSGAAGRDAAAAAIAALPRAIERRLLEHSRNRGKGAAVRTGCLAASGRYVVFIDADLATPPQEIGGLLAALEAGADVAIGVRRQTDGSDMRDSRSLPRRLAGRLFAGLAAALLFPGVSDSQCPLKAFRREAAQTLFRQQRIDSWAFDAELLFLTIRLGYRLAQIPVSWQAVAGSHLRLGVGTAAEVWNLARIRLIHWRLPARAALEEAQKTASPAP